MKKLWYWSLTVLVFQIIVGSLSYYYTHDPLRTIYWAVAVYIFVSIFFFGGVVYAGSVVLGAAAALFTPLLWAFVTGLPEEEFRAFIGHHFLLYFMVFVQILGIYYVASLSAFQSGSKGKDQFLFYGTALPIIGVFIGWLALRSHPEQNKPLVE